MSFIIAPVIIGVISLLYLWFTFFNSTSDVDPWVQSKDGCWRASWIYNKNPSETLWLSAAIRPVPRGRYVWSLYAINSDGTSSDNIALGYATDVESAKQMAAQQAELWTDLSTYNVSTPFIKAGSGAQQVIAQTELEAALSYVSTASRLGKLKSGDEIPVCVEGKWFKLAKDDGVWIVLGGMTESDAMKMRPTNG